MGDTFSRDFRARWSDMDFNQHMSNAAFLGCAEQTRTEYLDSRGWTMARFTKERLGPVVLEDRLTYQREIRMLEPFSVDLSLAAATPDARRIRIRNRFTTPQGQLCATIDSVVLWFDLRSRKPAPPGDELRDAWLTLVRSDDFEAWP
jgi:acyl-CoA thioester hydrolase